MLALRDKHGITIANGQGALEGQIFRIGHIGWFDVFDITTALAASSSRSRSWSGRRARRRHGARARGLRAHAHLSPRQRVLVREPIADAGVELLSDRFDVDVETNGDLAERIGDYDAIVIRSATKLTAD